MIDCPAHPNEENAVGSLPEADASGQASQALGRRSIAGSHFSRPKLWANEALAHDCVPLNNYPLRFCAGTDHLASSSQGHDGYRTELGASRAESFVTAEGHPLFELIVRVAQEITSDCWVWTIPRLPSAHSRTIRTWKLVTQHHQEDPRRARYRCLRRSGAGASSSDALFIKAHWGAIAADSTCSPLSKAPW